MSQVTTRAGDPVQTFRATERIDLDRLTRGIGCTVRAGAHDALVWRERDGYYALLFDGRVLGAPAGPEASSRAALAAVGVR